MGEVIVIFSDYSEIRRRGGRIYIKNRKTEISYPVHVIDAILIYGKTTITSDALDLCIENGIGLILLSQTGKIRGVLSNFLNSGGLNLRICQYELYKRNALDIAKIIIYEKIVEIESLYGCQLEEIKTNLLKAKTLQEVLQLEALASKAMFKIFAKKVRDYGFDFRSREYHPPKDEVNALLSFVYTVAHTFTTAYLLSKGLDPYLSFLHKKKGTHASFSSDIIEVLRPHLTKQVEKLIESEEILLTDFERTPDNIVFINRNKIELILEKFSEMSNLYTRKIKHLLEKILQFQKGRKLSNLIGDEIFTDEENI